MEVLLTHVSGIDVHKDMIMVTTLIGAPDEKPMSETFECSTFTEDLRRCGERLLSLGIKHVAMESTGIYWKPVYNVWKPMGLVVTLGNAYHMKNVPGRKTDVKDSQWIAQLHRNGLIQASYVPDVEFHQLRALTRHRTSLVRDINRVKNRLRKVLEDGNIKLGSMLSDVFGVSSLAIVRAIAKGITSPNTLADLVTTNIKRKEDIIPALTHCLRKDHLFLINQYLSQYDQLSSIMKSVAVEIDVYFERHAELILKLDEIPGIDRTLAQSIIAEATTNMKAFKDERTFAAWAGVAPGNNESARKKKRAKSRKGAPYLKKCLVQAANSAILTKGSFYQAKHNKLRFQLGSYNKATVAIANRIARALYHIIKNADERYCDLGENRADPKQNQIHRMVRKLEVMGYEVKLTEKTA